MPSVSQAHKLAPPGMGATAQGLLEGVHWGLGMSAGSLVGGVMYNQLGAVNTFYISAGESQALQPCAVEECAP
jgi:predicted MFS family arabinose efflux permease